VFALTLGLLVVWTLVAIIGSLVPGLFWLTVVGLALFLLTGAVSGARLARLSH
jgi:hypothetical protein